MHDQARRQLLKIRAVNDMESTFHLHIGRKMEAPLAAIDPKVVCHDNRTFKPFPPPYQTKHLVGHACQQRTAPSKIAVVNVNVFVVIIDLLNRSFAKIKMGQAKMLNKLAQAPTKKLQQYRFRQISI